MAKRNTGAESRSPQKSQALQAPKTEIDFESLIAAAIATVVVKPAKKWRRPKPKPKS